MTDHITIPADAEGTDRPRIVITSSPEGLDAGLPSDAAIQFFYNGTDYFYLSVSAVSAGAYGLFNIGSVAGGDNQSWLDLDRYLQYAAATLWGTDGVDSSRISMDGKVELFTDAQPVQVNADDLKIQGPNTTEFVSVGLGVLDIAAAAATNNITAETVVETLTDQLGGFSAERRYKCEYVGNVRSSVAGDRVRIRIRQQTATGAVVGDFGEMTLPLANTPYPVNAWVLYTGRQVVSEKVVLTVQRAAGTGAVTYTPINAMLTDVAPTTTT